MRLIFQKVKLSSQGQSLLEVIVALAIFSLIVTAMATMVLGSSAALVQGGEQTQAEGLAQQGIEAVRAIRDRAWNEIRYNQSGVTSTNRWNFLGQGSSERLGQYTRTIFLANVCRDGSNNITSCPGVYTDLHSKQITVDVSWQPRSGVTNTVQQTAYLTNWDSRDWTQTDWSGGDGQSKWSDVSRYDGDDGKIDNETSGQVKLAFLGSGCGARVWSFSTSSDYSFEAQKIVIADGYGQLLNLGTNLDNYTQGLWHLNEISGNLIDSSSNGNNLNLTSGSPVYGQFGKFSTALRFTGTDAKYINDGQQTGLDITGDITIEAWVYKTQAAVSYEVIVGKWQEVDNHRSYALLVGPNNRARFWLSSNGRTDGVATIEANSVLPLNQWVHLAGVYNGSNLYIFQNGALTSSTPYNGGIVNKQAFLAIGNAESLGGSQSFFNGLIDEARVSNIARWTNSFTLGGYAYGPAYASDRPSINPIIPYVVTTSSIDSWSSFTETATKNGGEIYYQLSPDNGNSWRYWTGSSWATAGPANYNTSTVINTNISSFPTSTGRIMFKAFLASDGTQLVQLDQVSISCEQYHDWHFSSSSSYFYDNQKIEVIGGHAQLIQSGGSTTTSSTYPTDRPIISPTSALVVQTSSVALWTSFTETAIKNGGEIYYQLSSDGGATWQYWNGLIWAVAGATEYNTSTIINANINSFSTSTGQIMFKAFLASDGAQQVRLGNVRIGWGGDAGIGGYETSAYLFSSAYNMGDNSPVQIIDWDEDLSSCSGCDIKFQLRTAPDAGGSPGIWTAWYGSTGSGTYFTIASGTLVSLDLNDNNWVQYRTELNGDGSATPVLTAVRVNYK